MACSGSSPNLTAASTSRADVQACLDIAVNGDTINIPAGSSTWTTGVTVTAGIGVTITGAGTPTTDPLSRVPSSSCTSGSHTAITIDGVIGFFLSPQYGNSTMRLSCMELIRGTTGQAWDVLGTCTASGCPNFRADNILFTGWEGLGTHINAAHATATTGDVFGVIDHCRLSGTGSVYLQLTQVNHAHYLGVGSWGDNAWHQTEDYGSNKFLFVENSTFDDAGTSEDEGTRNLAAGDQGGSKLVVRFNTFNISGGPNFTAGWHGTESGGRPRSGRALEYYGNDWICTGTCQPPAGLRGGTALVWGNNFDNSAPGAFVGEIFTLNTYRMFASVGGWLPCDGSAPWDENDGVDYYTGTVTAGGGTEHITVSGSPGWTTDQFIPYGAPYSFHNDTTGSGNEITTNGSNTFDFVLRAFSASPSNGDSIRVLRATRCLDQAGGVGAGILYNATDPPTPEDPADQVSSPLYAWDNPVAAGTPTIISVNSGRVIPDRDYYTESLNQTAQTTSSSPFDGTTGVGHGIIARRPNTCTVGVGYFATDQGSWNTSGNGFGSGLFYKCTATDTWTLFLTPYAYPHPLISGEPAPAPPAEPPPPAVRKTHLGWYKKGRKR